MPTTGRPTDLRAALVDYARALHEAYLAATPGDGADTPLAHAPFTVAIVAAGQLHLLATRDPLPDVRPHERLVEARSGPLTWHVRFVDASVLPALGVSPPADGSVDVVEELGVTQVLYHLIVGVNATLTEHHAMHAGTGLAHAHAAAGTTADGTTADRGDRAP